MGRPATPEELAELGVSMAAPSEQGLEALKQPGSPYITPPTLAHSGSNLQYGVQPTSGERMAMNIARPVALGAMGGAIAGPLPWMQAAGQGLAQAASEGIDYLTQPEEEQPSALGAGGRVAASMALPYGTAKVAQKVAPLGQKMQPVLSRMAKIPVETLENLGNRLKQVAAKVTDEVTAAKQAKDILMANLKGKIPNLPVDDFIDRLTSKNHPFTGEETEKLVNALIEKSGGTGSISLDDFQEFVREGWADVASGSARKAMESFYREFKDSVYSHIANSPAGPVAAQNFLDLTKETGLVRSVIEVVNKNIGDKGPVAVAQRFMLDKGAREAIEKIDIIIGKGSNLGGELEDLTKQFYAIEKRNAEVGATKAANAELLALQQRARAWLYSVMGGVTTAGLGAIPGGLLARVFNKLGGEAGPWEALFAKGVQGASKLSPVTTPAAIQGGSLVKDELFAAESDK